MQPDDLSSHGSTVGADLRRNVELKARLHSLQDARDVARRLATDTLGTIIQVDTYFSCAHGRLKLRETDRQTAQLIWYARTDQAVARACEYYLLDIPDPGQTKQLLAAALGIRQRVCKRREIYLVDNVRIHLDDVQDLGTFLEFEAVMRSEEQLSKGQAQVQQLMKEFSISPENIVPGSYGDMVFM